MTQGNFITTYNPHYWSVNKPINDNLEQQVQIMFDQHLVNNTATEFCRLSDIANINPKRTLSKNID